MTHVLWNYLARANLQFPKDLHRVRTAQARTPQFIEMYICEALWQSHTHPHARAMADYLEAEVWEALDRLGEHNGRPRSDALRDVVNMLTEALEREPDNALLEMRLQRRLKGMETAEIIEQVREGTVLSEERMG